jgi:hypothetical protein
MEEILQNEIKRQEYMEMQYKNIDEDSSKPDGGDDAGDDKIIEKSDKDEYDIKYIEENFNVEKIKILEELGLIINNN